MNQQPQLTRYLRLLQSFNWDYELSDDPRAPLVAESMTANMHALQVIVDPDGSIWMQERDRHGRGPLPVITKEQA